MRRTISVKALAIGLGALLMAAAPAVAQTSGGTADKSSGYTYEKKNEAMTHGKKLMSDFDVKMKELEAQISRDASATKADAQRQMKELKAKRAETSKQLDELGHASAQSWDSMKKSFANAYKDLQHSYDKAAASFKK
jgi:predicted  nucleic acid-binding Zn-ribbon protein